MFPFFLQFLSCHYGVFKMLFIAVLLGIQKYLQGMRQSSSSPRALNNDLLSSLGT